jgi:hypothetical protein
MAPRPPLSTLAMFGIIGCASVGALPTEKAESSAAAIRAAEEVGATHHPQAALHLQLAKEQFEHARRMPNPSDEARADRLLKRSKADAELALALARSEDNQAEARAATDKMKTLSSSVTQ